MIGETLAALPNSTTAVLLQKGASLTEENILLLCALPGVLCGFFEGQEIMTCLPEPFSKFIEPFLSCSLFESCPTL
jgi:hypothetical protein